MKRHEWRRQQRQDEKLAKEQNHVLTQYEKGYCDGYEAGKQEAMFELAGYCSRIYTTAIVAIHRSEDKFGPARIKRRLNLLFAQLQDILTGVVSEPKLRKWIQEETGIDLDEITGAKRLDIQNDWKRQHGDTPSRAPEIVAGYFGITSGSGGKTKDEAEAEKRVERLAL